MYLSRLILNPHSRRVQREIADPYQMHRSLMRAFANDLKKGDERVLYRLDVARNGGLTLLVQSWTLPDWSCLAEPDAHAYLLPVGEPNPAVKQFDLRLVSGQLLAFRLRANPTVKRRREDGNGGLRPVRDPLYREKDQLAWLERKGDQGGFRVVQVAIVKEGNTRGRQPLEKPPGGAEKRPKARQLTLHAVQFEGLLQVADPDRLREAVRRGIGSGKGFGFGLLSLARPVV